MKAKHTPGPWVVRQDKKYPGLTEIVSLEGPVIDEGFGLLNEREQANARLIAAAPEMLEALEGVAKNINPDDWFERVHAAIAKAKGSV